jgi:hypothetical protein
MRKAHETSIGLLATSLSLFNLMGGCPAFHK